MSSESELSDYDENFKKKSSKKEYRIKGALKAPRQTTFSTKALYDQIINGTIDLEPDYQRDVVWPEVKQVGVLDSMMRNFYIPPVIFATSISEDGTEKRVCIDGKQRLTSIQKFMDGEIFIRAPDTNAKFWFKTQKSTQERLPQKFRQLFEHKQVMCVEYQDLDIEQEREIFKRVQLGVALTPAEKMRAETATERSALAEAVKTQYLDSKTWLTVPFESRRGQPYRWAAASIYFMSNPAHRKAITADHLAGWLGDKSVPSPLDKGFVDGVHQTFRILLNIIEKDKSLGFLKVTKGNTKIAPVDFVAMLTLIWDCKSNMSEDELARRIQQMREFVRAKHSDLYWKPQVLATYMQFLESLKNGTLVEMAEDKAAPEYATPAPVSSPYAVAQQLLASPSTIPQHAAQHHSTPPSSANPNIIINTTSALQHSQAQGVSRLASVRAAKAASLPTPPQTQHPHAGPSYSALAQSQDDPRGHSLPSWETLNTRETPPNPEYPHVPVSGQMGRVSVPVATAGPGPWQTIDGSPGVARGGTKHVERYHPYASPPPTQPGDRRR